MDPNKQARLAAAGWKVGDAADFLSLSPAEAELVEIRHRLAQAVRTVRAEHHVSQAQLARILGSSQSRVAKIEAGDRSVSLDLMVRALLGLGLGHQELAGWLGAKSAA